MKTNAPVDAASSPFIRHGKGQTVHFCPQTMAEQAEALQGQLVERDRQLAAYKNVDLEKLQANLDAALGRAAQLEDMYKEKYGEAAALRQKLRAAGVRE